MGGTGEFYYHRKGDSHLLCHQDLNLESSGFRWNARYDCHKFSLSAENGKGGMKGISQSIKKPRVIVTATVVRILEIIGRNISQNWSTTGHFLPTGCQWEATRELQSRIVMSSWKAGRNYRWRIFIWEKKRRRGHMHLTKNSLVIGVGWAHQSKNLFLRSLTLSVRF